MVVDSKMREGERESTRDRLPVVKHLGVFVEQRKQEKVHMRDDETGKLYFLKKEENNTLWVGSR